MMDRAILNENQEGLVVAFAEFHVGGGGEAPEHNLGALQKENIPHVLQHMERQHVDEERHEPDSGDGLQRNIELGGRHHTPRERVPSGVQVNMTEAWRELHTLVK
jgi:hypothetical protein